MNVVGQQVGLGAHHQGVPYSVWSQRSCRQTGDGLVDVQETDVRVLAALTQSVGCRSLAADMRVVDKNLPDRDRTDFRTPGQNPLQNGQEVVLP